ncbi:hypothetical protein ACO0QE_002740 [Hanseniaspora vineae]
MNQNSVSEDGFWARNDDTSEMDSRTRLKRTVDLPVTIMSTTLTPEQATNYQMLYRIEELSKILNENNYEYALFPYRERSPSPPPIYDAKGKRTNTREMRYRKKIEDERHRLIDLALKLIPHYRAPEGYSKPTNFRDKFFIPVNEYTHINFVGLLLGPRGNTLKHLQQSTGCKIAIRGRGSVKEGKTSADMPKDAMNLSEPLHCVIIADSEEKLKRGLKACEAVVIKAVTSPEGQNDLKRGQLRELAELNGTLREDTRPCAICGLVGHKRFDCPKREVYADKIICEKCGKPGHVAQDCLVINRYQEQESSAILNRKRGVAEIQDEGTPIQNDFNNKRVKTVDSIHEPLSQASQSTTSQRSERQSYSSLPPGLEENSQQNTDSFSQVHSGPPGMMGAYGAPGDSNNLSSELPPSPPPPPPPPAVELEDNNSENKQTEEELPPPPGL